MKNRILPILSLLTVALLSAIGCRSQYEALLMGNDADAKYAEANRLFADGKFKKAASMYESLSMLTSGLEKDDTVRYFWALSNYKDKDYPTAEANFLSFIELYPRSPFTPEARFLRLDCLFRSTYRYELDQGPTRMAIVAINEYLIEYPESDRCEVCRKMNDELKLRLDTKAFEAARLYYKMEDYIAAKTAFRNILKENSENAYREQILYYIAKSQYKYASLSVASKQKERFMEFADDYFNFVGELPQSKYCKELDALYSRSLAALGRKGEAETLKSQRSDRKIDKEVDRSIVKEEKKLNR